VDNNELQVALEKIRSRHKTFRIAVVAGVLGFVAVVIIVCVTVLIFKHMDDPPWFKVVMLLLAPHGLVAAVVLLAVRYVRKRLKSAESRLESLIKPSPNGQPPAQ